MGQRRRFHGTPPPLFIHLFITLHLLIHYHLSAYICKWDKEEDFMAHHQMREMGMKSDTNLYEMAGCMLRLAMWPTEKMWEYIDKVIP